MAEQAPPPTIADFNAFPLTALDRHILSLTDAEFKPHTWSDIVSLISSNRLEEFVRWPSSLRRYLLWSQSIKAQYGSITSFVMIERLHWTPDDDTTSPPRFEVMNAVPFVDKADYKILRNDWPYGLEQGVTHLVAWLKTPVAVDEDTGDVTKEARRLIDAFVNRTFSTRLDNVFGEGNGGEHVVWFKNWIALQSVRGVDHVHVLVKDVPDDILDEWTI